MISSPNARCRTLMLFAAVFAASAAMPAWAADWKPDKPIEFVVPAPAGGALDMPARTVQRIWQELKLVEPPVNIVNRSGGGQAVAGAYVVQGAKDPHRLMLASTPMLVRVAEDPRQRAVDRRVRQQRVCPQARGAGVRESA